MRLSAAGRRRDGGGSAPAVQSAGAGARLLHLLPGVLRGRRGRRPGRAPVPRGPQSLAGAPLRAARGARWGGRRPPGPAARRALPPGPGGDSDSGGAASGDGRRVGGGQGKRSRRAVGETQPNFDLRHAVLMPQLRTSLAILATPEKKKGESWNEK